MINASKLTIDSGGFIQGTLQVTLIMYLQNKDLLKNYCLDPWSNSETNRQKKS